MVAVNTRPLMAVPTERAVAPLTKAVTTIVLPEAISTGPISKHTWRALDLASRCRFHLARILWSTTIDACGDDAEGRDIVVVISGSRVGDPNEMGRGKKLPAVAGFTLQRLLRFAKDGSPTPSPTALSRYFADPLAHIVQGLPKFSQLRLDSPPFFDARHV